MFTRPENGEYADYYQPYVARVGGGDIRKLLESQMVKTVPFLLGLGDEVAEMRYEPGKWSIKEVIGHVVDIERVFSYRALIFARGDKSPQPGVDQDAMVKASGYQAQTLAEIVSQYQVVRQATVAFFRSCPDPCAMRVGSASGYEFTVRSMPYIIAGHELHHLDVVRERYLKAR